MTETKTFAPLVGRCLAKGCKHVVRVQWPSVGRSVYRYGVGVDSQAFEVDVPGVVVEHRFYPATEKGRFSFQAVRWLRQFGCGEHDRMKWETVRGTLVEGKACDARCTSAKRADCECSCGGQNHGADHAAL